MENLSLSDIASVVDRDGAFGGSSAWMLVLLFIVIFGGGNFFGNRNNDATTNEILFGQQFQGLDNKIDRIGNGICDSTFALNNAINSATYNNMAEVRNVGAEINTGFANVQRCCCETNRNIDSVNYNGAINTASINATTTAQTQKILDAIAQSKIDTLTAKVTELEMRNALCGVVRYPNATTYNAGSSCFANGCGCGI